MSNPILQGIAERTFLLRGPDTRTVVARIGMPEPDPKRPGASRCPFQVTGLSNDDVQYASGVDSFQALNLAFAGIRKELQTSASVLAAFHKDFSLTWEGQAWELAIPQWIAVHDLSNWSSWNTFSSMSCGIILPVPRSDLCTSS